MDESLLVEIVAYAPTAFYHCTHCEVVWHHAGIGASIHAEQVDSGLPDDLAQEYRAVSDWVKGLFDDHGEKIVVKVIDAASLEGVARSLRHGLRRFPAVVVAGRHKFSGTDFRAVDEVIRQKLASVQPAGAGGRS
ncbi:MAG: hypothetical protein ACRDG5_00395 [Anaerolineales bacterium]